MRKYPKVEDGEWVWPIMTGYKMRCCDCALVHKLNFKIVKRKGSNVVMLQAFRDVRATAA